MFIMFYDFMFTFYYFRNFTIKSNFNKSRYLKINSSSQIPTNARMQRVVIGGPRFVKTSLDILTAFVGVVSSRRKVCLRTSVVKVTQPVIVD